VKGFLISAFLLFTFILSLHAQEWVVDTNKNAPTVSEQEVNFISQLPVIDGTLDKEIESLPARQFRLISRYNNQTAVPVTYRLAYGTEFLYVYIEADAEHLTFRDRAYQNGDGFILLIAKPKPDNGPADEFYELACSAVNLPEREWHRNIFWNYNVDKLFVPTSTETRMQFREGDGKISFELLLPWSDVRPNHPWLSDDIGINLTFCKAVEPKGQIWYQAYDDDNTGSEFKKRSYATLSFQKPVLEGNPQTFISIKEGHITEGEMLNAVAVTVSNDSFKETIGPMFGTGERMGMLELVSYDCNPGITKHEFTLDTKLVLEGAYNIRWRVQNKYSLCPVPLSVLPKFDEKVLNEKIENNKKYLSKGSYSTLQFMIKELSDKIKSLKIYETCLTERTNLIRLTRMINSVNSGVDPLGNERGFIRKAYRSKVDNTLQPYVVYLPGNYDKNKKYPLMIYLHGSASDETNIRGFSPIIPENFIAVGPLGRGKSNAYSKDNAQDDIAEVINAVEEDYNIDTTRLLLTGFSMGGYGVYRTFYETPGKFKAIAIFSGGPNLGVNYAPKVSAPDFTDEKNLNCFRGLPVFIFHGEKDMNVSLQATKDFSEKLIKSGAQVELQIEPGKGHDRPGKNVLEIYMKWVEKIMK
jgi:predicted esterase